LGSGVAMRWFANIYGWHWRRRSSPSLRDLGASCGSFCFSMPGRTISATSTQEIERSLPWNTGCFRPDRDCGARVAVIFQFCRVCSIGMQGGLRSFPHGLDQKYLVVLGWDLSFPVVWGFSAPMVAVFLAIRSPRSLVWAALCPGCSGRCLRRGQDGPSPQRSSALSAITMDSRCACERPTHGHAKLRGSQSKLFQPLSFGVCKADRGWIDECLGR